jgi:hypothetical protein
MSDDDAPPPSYSSVLEDSQSKSYVQLEIVSSSAATIPSCMLRATSLTAFAPTSLTRTPLDLLLLVDVSGSMDSEVTGVLEGSGLTRLQLVQHALKIIVRNLTPHDSFTLVEFSQTASVRVGRTKVTADAADRLIRSIESLRADGNTNLYDGLKTAYDYLTKNPPPQDKEEFLNRHIVVLSDGCPSVNPPSTYPSPYTGLMQHMQHQSLVCRHTLVHCFGMTHGDLDDRLLALIAQQGHGMYGFISDGTIVSPCFINILGVMFNMLFTGLELTVRDAAHAVPQS